MLKKVEFLPKEHLIRKYSQITGMPMSQVREIADREGIETIADMVEEYLLVQAIRNREI